MAHITGKAIGRSLSVEASMLRRSQCRRRHRAAIACDLVAFQIRQAAGYLRRSESIRRAAVTRATADNVTSTAMWPSTEAVQMPALAARTMATPW